MKIICAGLPKTGSKSCSSALRELGYKVADNLETIEFLSYEWRSFVEGESSIESVLTAYDRHGFDANQDLPGNVLWEDMYRASPKGTKVILTIRDNEEKWWNSWKKFIIQEYERVQVMGVSYQGIMGLLSRYGYLGTKMQNFYNINKIIVPKYFRHQAWGEPMWMIQSVHNLVKSQEFTLKQLYRTHNEYVKSVVPKEDLLIWNVKDGWEPLCSFLQKEIPNNPIPHDNKGGDMKWNENYAAGLIEDIGSNLKKNLSFELLRIGVVIFVGWKCYQTNGKWLREKTEFIFNGILRN